MRTDGLNTIGIPGLRLQQLVSQGLPVGAFSYSQGTEWAVEAGWISGAEDLLEWLEDLLDTSMTYTEVPLFKRLHDSAASQELGQFTRWSKELLACRETAELRMEERHRGRAFAKLLPAFSLEPESAWAESIRLSQLGGFAWVVSRWQIDSETAAAAYLWSWLENAAMAGVRLVPLGQTAGQQVIYGLSAKIPDMVRCGFAVSDDQIGFSCVAQAIASSRHENQYTRLYRS